MGEAKDKLRTGHYAFAFVYSQKLKFCNSINLMVQLIIYYSQPDYLTYIIVNDLYRENNKNQKLFTYRSNKS